MKNNMIWLSISLFCSESQWHKLFADGITPFLALYKPNAYNIEFNYLSGENIRLSLLTLETNAPQLAQQADDYFKKYFAQSNLFAPSVNLPAKGLFMPFPANTVQYGLYQPNKINEQPMVNQALSYCLSQAILAALADDSIDDETIITFAFHLQMGLIKTMAGVNDQFINSIKSINHLPPQQTSMDLKVINDRYEESKETLTEITKDVFTGTDLPPWLEQWITDCEKQLETHNTSNIDEVNTWYNQVLYLIKLHLAITPGMSSILHYFIKQSV